MCYMPQSTAHLFSGYRQTLRCAEVAAHLLEPVTDSLCARVIPHYHIVVRLASVPGG
jgi:hypothetical protein